MRHRGQVAGAASTSGRACAGMCRAHQVVIGAASRRRRWRRRAAACRAPQATTCGFIGLSVRRAALVHQLAATPSCRPAPSPGTRGRPCAASSGSSACSVAAAVADQADLDRIAQADAHRVEVDLHAARLAGLRVELDVGERACRPSAACRSSSIASCDGLRAEQADAAGGVRAVVGHRGLAEQRLDDRARRASRRAAPARRPRRSAPRPARIATFLPAFSTSAARRRSSSAGSRALRAHTSEVWCGDVALRALCRSTSCSCRSTGNVMWATPR